MAQSLHQISSIILISPRATPSSPRSSNSSSISGFPRLPPRRNSSDLRLRVQCRSSHGFTVTCLFSNNRKQEQAKKAVESALAGKKEQFEKWNKEIERKREKYGGGGEAGGGGWFGGGGRFGWSNDEHSWEEAQQTGFTVLAILVISLLIAKRDTMLAAVVNPTLFVLRHVRESLSYIGFRIERMINGATDARLDVLPEKATTSTSKERVLKKWGGD